VNVRRALFAAVTALLLHAGDGVAQVAATDFFGREVQLAQPAQRIVALGPHIVENVFSAGAGDRLVGVVEYSDYPEPAADIPRVGNFHSWSLEAIVALRPDLVIVWGSGNGADSVAALERLGIKVFVSELRNLQDIPQSIRAISTLAGTETVGEPEARRIERKFQQLRQRYARAQPVSVFYQIWDEPLQTVNGEHMISQVIALCGGRNIFADTALIAPRVNIESVLQSNPDAIVASGMDAARPEWLDRWRNYPALAAVANDTLFFIPPDHLQRPTARLLLGAGQLCEQLAGVVAPDLSR
jgi:iron complex transport system substrate-binding protein